MIVRTCLGDPASALSHAKRLIPQTCPPRSARARFCIDTARDWQAFGRPAHTLQALLAAESFAPGEVCLGWQAQDRLELILIAGAIVLRPSSDGLFSLRRG